MSNLPIINTSDPYYYFYTNMIRNYREYDLSNNEQDLLNLCNEITYKDTFEIKECPITLEKINDNDLIMELPCNHQFSKNAIITWFKKSTKCPLCRYNLVDDSNTLVDDSNTLVDDSNTLVDDSNTLSISDRLDVIIDHLSEYMLNEIEPPNEIIELTY